MFGISQVIDYILRRGKKQGEEVATTIDAPAVANQDRNDDHLQPAPQHAFFREPSIDEFLQQLPEEQRRYASIGLVRKEAYDDPQAIDAAIEFLKQTKDGYHAVPALYLKKNNPEAALQFIFEQHIYPELSAADFAKKHISIDRAISILEDVVASTDAEKMLNREKQYEALLELYQEKGDESNTGRCFSLAITEYQKTPSHLHFAIKLADNHNKKALALELTIENAEKADKYNKYHAYADAALRAEELGDDRAKQLYKSAFDAALKHPFGLILGSHKNFLLKCAEKIGTSKALIKTHVKIAEGSRGYHKDSTNHYESAAKLAEEIGYFCVAAEFYRRAENPKKAIDILVNNDHLNLAIKVAKENISDKHAAYLALEHQRPEEALALISGSLAINYVCGTYENPDYFSIAIRASDALGNDEQKQHYLQQAIDRFSALGNFTVCKQFALQQGNTNAAMVYDRLAKVKK